VPRKHSHEAIIYGVVSGWPGKTFPLFPFLDGFALAILTKVLSKIVVIG